MTAPNDPPPSLSSSKPISPSATATAAPALSLPLPPLPSHQSTAPAVEQPSSLTSPSPLPADQKAREMLEPSHVAGTWLPLPTWKDFYAGTCAGVAITLVGHPFDTIKVRLQTQDLTPTSLHSGKGGKRLFTGALDCAYNTMRKEGFLALYKGMASPMVTIPVVNAIVFAAYEQGKQFFYTRMALPDALHSPEPPPLTLNQIAIAGGWAGLVNCAVITPIELVKSRLQIQYDEKGHKGRLSGPLSVIKEVIHHNGVRGLFLGMNTTVIREIPAYTAQFYVYEWCKRVLTPPGESVNNIGPLSLMLSGAAGGMMAWVVSYPQDVIKSRLQIQPEGQARMFPRHRWLPDGGFVSAAKQIWREKGTRGFWVGFGACAIRALPANAAGFLAYEWALRTANGL